MTEDEIQAIENHISNIPATAGMYAPVLLQWLRAMLKERAGLLRLAYIGEHYFPDQSWKTRCEELLDELHERKEDAGLQAKYERLRYGVVANAGRHSSDPAPRWSHVADATGLGSTSAAALCRDAGFDPDVTVFDPDVTVSTEAWEEGP